jgi:voltage-gated potassium channel
MIVAALLVVPVVVIDETQQGGTLRTIGAVLNWVIWTAFAAELGVLLARAPDRGSWLWRHPFDVALVVLTPPFLPGALQALRIARVMRVVRLLRLLRLARTARAARTLFAPQSLSWAALLTALVVIGGGAAFVEAEHAQHLSLNDGLWWALTTVTTVAYGDIYPHTATGRVIAAIVMLSGISFVAFLTAAAAHRFITTAEVVEAEESAILREIRELRSQIDALTKPSIDS